MAKYSFELKKRIVIEYLSGGGSRRYLADKYGLGDDTQVRKWLNA